MSQLFCIDGIWNQTLFLNRNYPIFTECFQYSIILIPSIILNFSFFIFHWLKRYRDRKFIKVPCDIWCKIKLSLQVLLLGLIITEIILDKWLWNNGSELDRLYILSYSFLSWTLCLVIFQTELRRRTNHLTCPLLFAFWCSSTVAYLIRFYCNIIQFRQLKKNISQGVFIGVIFHSGAVFLLFLMSFILDSIPHYSSHPNLLTKQASCPEENASILSKLTFSWLDKYIYQWYRHEMTEKTVFDLRAEDESTKNTISIEELFKNKLMRKRRGKTSYSIKMNSSWVLFVSLFQPFSLKFVLAWCLKVIGDAWLLGMPFLLKMLLQFLKNDEKPSWVGYGLAVLFLLAGTISSLCDNFCLFVFADLGLRIRSVLMGMIYKKYFRMSTEVRNVYTAGEAINLIGVDAERVMKGVEIAWFIFSCPFQIIILIIIIYQEISYAAFVGIAIIISFFILNSFIMKLMERDSDMALQWKDKRVKIMADILNGIKVLKMYAWENSFLSKVMQLRTKELKYVLRVLVCWCTVNVAFELIPFFVLYFSFLTYIHMDKNNVITAQKIFVSLSVLNLMRFPMIILPLGFTETVKACVSLNRIGEYLAGEEMDNIDIKQIQKYSTSDSKSDIAINIESGSFSWKKQESIILNKIDLIVPKGKLVAIVGKVGTGKSSLISAILGEMHKESGSVKIEGEIAYVPQEAWIQNMSVKENILFTAKYEPERYKKIINACALTKDLEQLPAGDETEIGERGINLSGGQKQRVSLARAVYQNRDIYLLDDPLSAVDAHVGQHLFDHVISDNGVLKGKTRILVTHGLNWLPYVDEIFVFDTNGCISEKGSFKDLMKNQNQFVQFIEDHLKTIQYKSDSLKSFSKTDESFEKNKNPETRVSFRMESVKIENPESKIVHERNGVSVLESDHTWPPPLKFSNPRQKDGYFDEIPLSTLSGCKPNIQNHVQCDDILIKPTGKLICEEEAILGSVNWRTYFMYIKARGLMLSLIAILIFATYFGLQLFINVWLEKLSSESIIGSANSTILQNSSFSSAMSKMIKEKTSYYMNIYLYVCISMILTVSIFCVVFNIGSFMASKIIHRDLLSAILLSPMQFFNTTPSGRILNRFSKDMELLDEVIPLNINDIIICIFALLSSLLVIIYVTPWFITIIFPISIIYYFVQLYYMPTSRQSRRLDSIAISPVFNHFTETLQGIVVIKAFREQDYFHKVNHALLDRNTKFKFIQIASQRWIAFRVDTLGNILVFGSVIFAVIGREYLTVSLVGLSIAYSLQITEALNWLVKQYTELETNSVAIERIHEFIQLPTERNWKSDCIIPESWPTLGKITFENYDLRYRENLPLALDNINLHLNGGEKIGVVGRTGAGKSSMTFALFRLVEAARGAISIDGVDISKLSLQQLRRNITILPQDPVIFSGTIRENIDPFNKHSNEEIYQCLETAHLMNWISSVPQGIDYECNEGGTNLSAGQKQLLCLARALLRKSKVLILDEATASVDVETDRLVMQTIREHFRTSTVIIIAHRIDTILDTDKIVVMDNGKIIEMDTPKNLLLKPQGLFRSLANQINK